MDKQEKIANYFEEEHPFKPAIGILRDLALKTEVVETYKWQFPTYTVNDKNVFAICKFKNHFGIWFFNGAFLKDPNNVLQNAQEGKTKAMRNWKFTSPKEVDPNLVLCYLEEAIENQKQGKVLATAPKKTKTLTIPELLANAMANDDSLKNCFAQLTPYKQREHCEYIATAKQEKTKLKRLEKITALIKQGKGLNDGYR